MKSDAEVVLMKRERAKGRTQEQAAARAGMGVATARKYEHSGKLPSQLKAPRDYRTRPNPFEEDWAWVTAEIQRDPALQVTTLFALLTEQHPGRYQAGQLRTLQRQIVVWKAQHGPEKEVFFPQVHEPGRVAQSDFTHMTDLGVTLGGIVFPHLVFHLVLTYSNVEAVSICLSESFESLAEGLETCLWQIGGVPREHRTDHLSAAIRPLDVEGRTQATTRYKALLAHYGLDPTTNNAGEAHENGDVEQAHHRFKVAVDQALRVRGNRDFADRAAYARFLQDLVRKRNLTRETRFAEERQVLRPLPTMPLGLCREFRVVVSRFSTIQVLSNAYSVPSRLIGTTLTVRVHAETVEAYQGTAHLFTVPRLLGKGQHRIDYRHVIWAKAASAPCGSCASPAPLPTTVTTMISTRVSSSVEPTTPCARRQVVRQIDTMSACCTWRPRPRRPKSRRRWGCCLNSVRYPPTTRCAISFACRANRLSRSCPPRSST